MPDLDTVAKLINSPPGQLVAGAALAGIVWKFFERIEAVLTDGTKHEIARWLRVRSVETALIADPIVPWPETFATIFDRVFGIKHLSLKCFGRSCVVTLVVSMLSSLFLLGLLRPHSAYIASSFVEFFSPVRKLSNISWFAARVSAWVLVFDYASLLETRLILSVMRRHLSFFATIGLLLVDIVATGATGFVPTYLYNFGFAWGIRGKMNAIPG